LLYDGQQEDGKMEGAMQTKANLRARRVARNHNETLVVRSALKAGGVRLSNHTEAPQTRTGLKAGKLRRREATVRLVGTSALLLVLVGTPVRATEPVPLSVDEPTGVVGVEIPKPIWCRIMPTLPRCR
jgi:hypothetical protein